MGGSSAKVFRYQLVESLVFTHSTRRNMSNAFAALLMLFAVTSMAEDVDLATCSESDEYIFAIGALATAAEPTQASTKANCLLQRKAYVERSVEDEKEQKKPATVCFWS